MNSMIKHPTRFALQNIFSNIYLHITVDERRVIRNYTHDKIKQTKVKLQISNLLHLKNNNLFPQSIHSLKLPDILQSHTRPCPQNLEDLPIKSYKRRVKIQNKLQSTVSKLKKDLLNLMISRHFCDLSDIEQRISECQPKINQLTTSQRKIINKSLEEATCTLRKTEKEKHSRKGEKIRNTQCSKSSKSPKPEQRPILSTTEQTEPKQYPGVTCLTEEGKCAAIIPLLDKGRNYKITPNNMKNVVKQTEVGVQRLICGLKYANPAWKVNLTPSTYDTDPLKVVAGRFDKDLNAPPRPTKEIEQKIDMLKSNIKPVLQNIAQEKIIQNVHKKDLKAVKEVKADPNISINLSDKTQKIIIIDPNIVKEKTLDHLQNPNLFIEIDQDPSQSIEKKASHLLSSIYTTSDPKIYKLLYPEDSRAPVIQPLLKDHKPAFPDCNIRPVQPVTNSAIEKLDILTSKILLQITPHLSHRIKSTAEFKKRLTNLPPLPEGSFMASLDIVNMYPNMPTDDKALNVIKTYLSKYQDQINLFGFSIDDTVTIIEFVLHNTYISYEDSFFIQRSGVGTGNHSSGPYSEIIVDYTYTEALKVSSKEPTALSLYVDDCWMSWTDTLESFYDFLTNLNSIWDSVKFEEELESENSINFLDLKITRLAHAVKYEFYQKPTHSGRYLHYDSHCAMSTKINIVKSEARRVINNCSDPKDSYKYLEKIKSDFVKSGYPSHLINSVILESLQNPTPTNNCKNNPHYILKIPYISEAVTRVVKRVLRDSEIDARVVVTSGNSIENLIKPSTGNIPCHNPTCPFCPRNIPCNLTHYVYKLQCTTCPSNNFYVGCSRRVVTKRMGNHEASVRRHNMRTTPGQHMLTTHPETKGEELKRGAVDIEKLFQKWKPEILYKARDTLDTYLWEGIFIRDLDPTLNNVKQNGFVDF